MIWFSEAVTEEWGPWQRKYAWHPVDFSIDGPRVWLEWYEVRQRRLDWYTREFECRLRAEGKIYQYSSPVSSY